MPLRPDEPEEDALPHVHLNLDAMLPGIAEELRADAQRRLWQEYPWVRLVNPALACAVMGVIVAALLGGGRALGVGVVLVGVAIAGFLCWRKTKIDHCLRQRLAGPPRCRECGYRLSGIYSVRCPECGTRVRLSDETNL